MKKFVLLCAVVSLALGVSFAQSVALKSSDQVSASVTRAHLPADGIRLGPNPVCLTATHPDGTVFYHECSPNTWTNAGYDAMIAQIGSTGSQPAAFTYLALSSDATAPAKTDTVLASEITTNGLARHVA